MRYELSDCEWNVIRPMLPNKVRGIPRVDDRRILNGIFWVLRSGALSRADTNLRPFRSLRYGARMDEITTARLAQLFDTTTKTVADLGKRVALKLSLISAAPFLNFPFDLSRRR